jgi:hypothetical protein
MFESNMNKGVNMKFQNGFEVSIQFGQNNYCTTISQTLERTISTSAEMAIYDHNNKMIEVFPSYGGNTDSVEGWLGTDDVARVISIVANASNREQIEVGLANMRYNKHDNNYVK